MTAEILKNPDRRRLLALAGGALGLMLMPDLLRAAVAKLPTYPMKAFNTPKVDEVLQLAFDGRKVTPSDKVKLTAPEIAANGAVVPVSAETTLPKVTRMAFMVDGNPYALASDYVLPAGTEPYVSNRIKMKKTSNVIALVESDGKLYSATKKVKVTVGGCGG
ncbi:MAG: thiosulfate oxidation carrier protein SoxY [Sinobacteraceae bacterium]|nr:thiosulfate oxidation carrier protein SoxY [Nevskiaceae bacterium]